MDDDFSAEEMNAIGQLAPLLSPPDDPTNAFADHPDAASLGQQLFFERRYSAELLVGEDGSNGGLGAVGESGKVACASCHMPEHAFSDGRSRPGNVSLGVKHTTRNTPSLVNVAYYEWHGWGGKQDSLWTQASLSPESSSNTGGNRCDYAHMVWEHYREPYTDVFGEELPAALDPASGDADRFPARCKPKKSPSDPDGAWEQMSDDDRHAINQIMANCGKAVAAYERRLVSRNAPFDRFVEGDRTAISASAKRGLRLFIGKAGCAACHSGTSLSDNDFHNTGVPQVGPNVPEEDDGRYTDVSSLLKHTFNTASEFSDDREHGEEKLADLAPRDDLRGAFRTKSLRNVAESAPYFHNGSMATLRDVIEFYNDGGGSSDFVGTQDAKMVSLNLTQAEIDDLVAFLETLTGDPIPEDLRVDTSAAL